MSSVILTPEAESIIIRLLQTSLEQTSDVPNSLDLFSKLLKESNELPSDIGSILANGVDKYCSLIRNQDYLQALRKTFNLVFDYIYEKEKLNFKIEGRRKSVVNSIEKMLRLIKQGKSLENFRDSMGIRIIIFGDESEDLQRNCYDICEEIINFMLSKHFTLCNTDKTLSKVDLDENVNVLTPEKSLISQDYQSRVKDYILYPKSNGYQSLHLIFQARNGSFVEIQIRTEQMHLNAEHFSADHLLYKLDKYGEQRLHSKLDFSKVHMPGFRYLSDSSIYDDIGLQTGLLTFHRTKSF